MTTPAATRHEPDSLAEFLAPGVTSADLPELFPLLAAKPLLAAFTALFHGSEDAVIARLLVLREIGARAETPQWTPAELEARFAYIDAVKLDTILKRLREHALLVWDGERRHYQLAASGRMALAALEQLLEFSAEDDAELGYITSQIAAGAATGRVSAEVLRHLLARLTELEGEFEQAVRSGSEYQLKLAQDKLASVWQWMEKGNEVVKNLTRDGLDDNSTWRLAQEIGARQSRIMRMTGVFQRELSKIARQQVHLSQGGLTTSDLASWLRGLSAGQLADLLPGTARAVPEPVFILPDVMLDVAEYELLERERHTTKVSRMPIAAAAEETLEYAIAAPPELARLTTLLGNLGAPKRVADVVVGNDYRTAAYRFSLLPLIGEPIADPDLAAFAELAVSMQWDISDPTDAALETVNRHEVAAISPGLLAPNEPNQPPKPLEEK